MPKTLLACDVVIRLFQTFSRAFVRSSLVHERGGPPRGAECCPFELRPKITTVNLGLAKELCELGAETLELTEFRLKFWKETGSEWKQRAVEWELWPVFPLLSSSLDLGELGMMRK